MTNLKELQKVVDFLGVGETPQKADVIFVYGHFEDKIAHKAADLFKEGYAPKILIAGRKTRHIPEEFATEAQYFKSLIMQAGVPEDAIILEEKSTNTLEDTVFGMRTLQEQGIEPRKVILCAHVHLLRRAKATFKQHFPTVETFAVPYEIHDLEDEFWIQDRISRMLLEFDRMKEFAEKGDIAHVDVPKEIKEAAQNVKENLPEPPTTQL